MTHLSRRDAQLDWVTCGSSASSRLRSARISLVSLMRLSMGESLDFLGFRFQETSPPALPGLTMGSPERIAGTTRIFKRQPGSPSS